MDTLFDVIIVGSGPSGLTAAIYATRANLKTLVLAGGKWGGQLMLTTDVENFPGFPDGILGPELMMNMRKQAEKFGATIVEEEFEKADYSQKPYKITAGGKEYKGKTLLIATGADTLWLNVPGEKEKIGRGVSSCAPCDAAFFRNKNVIVVGGGDSAMEEALFLTKFADKITLVHRRDEFKASQIMLDRAFANPKITFILNTQITEVLGDQVVTGVKLTTTCSDGQIIIKPTDHLATATPEHLGGKKLEQNEKELSWELPIDGIFVAIGHIPNSKIFEGIEKDEKGFVKKHDHFKTNIDGVFVAGDVHDMEYKQAITAAGYGCAAALEIEKYLQAMDQTS